VSEAELEARRAKLYDGKQRSILDVCKQAAPGVIVAAEFKRASPSKSDIAVGLDLKGERSMFLTHCRSPNSLDFALGADVLVLLLSHD